MAGLERHLHDPHAAARWESAERLDPTGRLVAFVGAHGGAGTTSAVLAVAADAERGVCLVDADLAGGDAGRRLGFEGRPGDAGAAAAGEASGGFAGIARRAPFGWFAAASPRPDLAWLIRDGAMRRLIREALGHSALVLVDAGRPLGPSCEPVVDADVVVVVAHAHRVEAAERTRRRLVRLGVDERRLIDCPLAPTVLERVAGRWRGAGPCIDLERGDELLLLIEGRLAALPPQGDA